MTYAFSLYGLDRTAEGLDIIKKLPPEQLHDPHAAVYVALLLLDENQADAARDYIEVADRGPIYLEEKKLLSEAKAKLAPASPTPSASPSPTPAPASTPAPTSTPINKLVGPRSTPTIHS